MIDIKRTKARILSLAFSGALTSAQHDCTNNSSLEDVHKRVKQYKPVTEDEKLIDTPAHWLWSRIGYVTSNHGQTTPSETFCYIDVGTLDNKHQKLSRTENVVEAKDAPSRAKKMVERGDVLYSTVRPYLHNICIVDRSFSHTPIASTAFCVMRVDDAVLLNRFLFYWLLTNEFDGFANGNNSKGTLYPAIGEKALLNGVIPIPPIEEQERIVDLLSQAFACIEQIEEAQDAFDKDMQALKTKALEAGIRGELTEQLQSDGDADTLLAEIAADSDGLQAENAVHNANSLLPIPENETPFAIPRNWLWVRLSDIGATNIGLTYHPEDISDNGTMVIRSSNIVNWKMDYTDLVRVNCAIRDNQYLYPNDIVICARNGSKALVGKCAIFDGPSRSACFGAFMAVFRTRIFEYVYYYLQTDAFRRYFTSDDTKQINQVTQKILKNALIPLPPLPEIERIVARIDELLNALPS